MSMNNDYIIEQDVKIARLEAELKQWKEANCVLSRSLTEACKQRTQWRGRALKAEARLRE